MFEIDEAARMITESCDPNANIIFGTSIDEKYTGEIKVTVIATGFSEESNTQLSSHSRGGFGQSNIFGKAPPAQPNRTAPTFGTQRVQNSQPSYNGNTSHQNPAPSPL